MDGLSFHLVLLWIQRSVSLTGIIVILLGVFSALFQYVRYFLSVQNASEVANINQIRLKLGRTLILGLEFIVAADLIGTTTTPDYYSVGILGAIVLIRTVLTYTLNRELMSLTQEQAVNSPQSKAI